MPDWSWQEWVSRLAIVGLVWVLVAVPIAIGAGMLLRRANRYIDRL